LIDAADTSVLSNITTIKIEKFFTPLINRFAQYVLEFSNPFYNPHEGHNSAMGGVITSTGFTVVGNNNTLYFDDDGNGNIRTYYLVGGTTRTYVDNTAGTVDYTTGKITITSLNISGTSNTDGTIAILVVPNSNDVVPVRNQLIEIDFENIDIQAEVDTITSGGSSAGTGYTTSPSYQG